MDIKNDYLGLGKRPGDSHYRAFVGPARDYDFIAAMCFNLLTCLGLRQSDRVLDIGCGSLRLGRILIPFLNKGNYYGVEPNKWLIQDGITNELGRDIVSIKSPVFLYASALSDLGAEEKFKYVIAQSIFSHTGLVLLENWIYEVSSVLLDDGCLLATYLESDEDYEGIDDWVYPGCVSFSRETISVLASKYDLEIKILDWFHPRQKWVAFFKKSCQNKLLFKQTIHWNNLKEVWK